MSILTPRLDPIEAKALAIGSTYILGYAELVGSTGTSVGAIPVDATIPQISEGTQILTLTVTPNFIGSRIIVDAASVGFRTTATVNFYTIALFKDGAANAVRANGHAASFSNSVGSAPTLKYSMITTSLTPIVFTLRAGYDGGSGNVINQGVLYNGVIATFGDTVSSTMQVTEIK